jgi:hypothetical protein
VGCLRHARCLNIWLDLYPGLSNAARFPYNRVAFRSISSVAMPVRRHENQRKASNQTWGHREATCPATCAGRCLARAAWQGRPTMCIRSIRAAGARIQAACTAQSLVQRSWALHRVEQSGRIESDRFVIHIENGCTPIDQAHHRFASSYFLEMTSRTVVSMGWGSFASWASQPCFFPGCQHETSCRVQARCRACQTHLSEM